MFCEGTWLIYSSLSGLVLVVWMLKRMWTTTCVAKTNIYCLKSPLNKFVLERCTRMHTPFKLPFWAQNGHIQSVLDSMFRVADVKFIREMVELNDGGEVAIDWGCMKHQGLDLDKQSPVLFVLPGLTGDATGMSHLCRMALLRGYRPVVFNKRGHGGTLLKTPKMQSFGDPSDLREVILHVKAAHPDTELTAVGHSAGSGLLVSYLGEYSPSSHISAGICVSPGYDAEYLFQHCMMQPYNYILLMRLKKIVSQHRSILAQVMDIDKALKARTVAAFEEEFYCKLYGYNTMKKYWDSNNPMRDINKISVPVLCISGLDDPVCTKDCISYSMVKESEYPILITTTGGGHCGFVEGNDLECWADKVALDYVTAVLDFKSLGNN